MNAASRPIKLACRNVWKVYGRRPAYYFDSRGYVIDPDALAERLRAEAHLPAVVDASFEVATGEIFVIMGLSGSGKSTLVRCLSRLVEPSAGEILLDGKNLLQASGKELIELRRHAMGMVFQNFGLLPHLTVLDNVAFPLKIQGKPAKEREARAREMISLVGLEGRETSFPHELSGGQQQRVGIARSLAVGPELWFLDEPFSALDPLIRRQMQDEFLRLQRMLKKTIIFITHDIAEAFRLADRLAIMRAGKIVQIGRPADIVLNPADDYVAQFTEDMPLLRVITAGDIATSANGAALPERSVAADTSLEALIPQLASGVAAFTVPGTGGSPPAVLDAAAVLAVLEREQARRTRP
ncbi:MAG: ATP-binding cassette domain-containing protein [Mesorhizobium sp.]|uniref:quaternary amine ABC transporter ATP-binding protein n=1 Tax=Mesorhizobium sp. TaxID=1871066 RepID=UPI00121DBC24|nr:betaine/proline/choline family ABC transporter ATP-binding protein [Mesorhizobium sp.]TIO77799.1 MAG: ATP-binding cassette domain-containing protein [Mesorhizobium sp.]TIO85609.1 MAG: ATP-binding cassette domain-containing protein [Mesorhizobium sp.]